MTSLGTVKPTARNSRSCRAIGGTLTKVGHKYEVQFERCGGKSRVTSIIDFSSHPLRLIIGRYLFHQAENLSASTIFNKCRRLGVIGEFLKVVNERELNPKTHQSFLQWLRDTKGRGRSHRFNENTIMDCAGLWVEFYKFGLQNRYAGFSQRDLDTIVVAQSNMLRGASRRTEQISIDKALSQETFYNLLKAMSLELEQCRRVSEQRKSGARVSLYADGSRGMLRLDPNPYVVLAGVCGLLHGIRSSEFSSIKRADLRVDPAHGQHELFVHATNKDDGYIPVDDLFLEVWSLCEEWDRDARACARNSENTADDPGFVYSASAVRWFKGLVPLRTTYLNRPFLLHFYKKWFEYEIPGEDGVKRPLLHAENDPTRPLWCPYSKYRNAFGVHLADRQRDRKLTKEALRHEEESTGDRFYKNKTKLDHAKRVYHALKPEAQILAMKLKNPIMAGINADTLERAKRANASTPHGLCGAAMEGENCVRASGCLNCPHLVIIASRKPRFEADRKDYEEKAKKLEAKGDIRGAENALSQAKLCQAHIIRIDDMFGRGSDE
jgi:hypothetical protein